MKLVGTSGYDYKGWCQLGTHLTFFPDGCKDKLKYYSQHFNLLEANCTFYRLPSSKTMEKWYNTVPLNFKFILKFSQYITHSKRFKEFNSGWDKFMEPASKLREKLYGVLFQFPATFHFTPENVKLFQQANQYMTSTRPLIYLELRSETWFCTEAIEIIKELDWILVISSNYFGWLPSQLVITKQNHVMLRMHGLLEHCHGDYTEEQLSMTASMINNIENVVVCFNNTDTLDNQIILGNRMLLITNSNEPHAIKNAKTMSKLL